MKRHEKKSEWKNLKMSEGQGEREREIQEGNCMCDMYVDYV